MPKLAVTPPVVGDNLKYLSLSRAGFGGRIPRNLGDLTNLHFLDLSQNEFSPLSNINWISLPTGRILNDCPKEFERGSRYEIWNKKISLCRWCSSPLVERIFAFRLQLQAYLFFEMAKKKSCQNVRNPRVLSPATRELYGWVDAEVFTQSSVLASEHLPELRREMRLAQDLASERDYILEAAGPFDRLPFRALEDRTHFLWVYVELFTRLGIRLPFSDFQREVLKRCQVAASQLHLNGWGFLRIFERVCLHFGFRPSWRIFLYTYQLHAPPPGNGFLSFRAYQGRRLFDAFEESIQEFKWHYFKVLPLPGTHPFWVDDEGRLYPWVYWNSEARECRRSNFWCRWILDHSDAEVGAFLDSLLADMEKQSCFDRLKQKMAEVAGVGPRSVLPHVRAPPTTSGASASSQAIPASAPTAPATPNPIPIAAKKGDPLRILLGSLSLFRGRRVSPVDRAFPEDYNFRGALDAGLTNYLTREILGPLVPEQLLGTAQHLTCQLTACLQIGIEKAFASKIQMEKELASLKDQVDVLTVERDSALAAPLLNAEIKSLTQRLQFSEGERLSALARMTEVEERAKVQAAELESYRAALLKEKKEAEEETGDMVQETFEILMDQVRHLHPAIDFSMISLGTRWDPKAKRIYNPKAEAQEQSEPVAEEQPSPEAGVLAGGDAQEVVPEASAKEGGECLVPNV
ncbi:hypothetical protein PIB30_081957 [Stylosanthes scabra]|uniref:Transposase (putative) gypsy type domain-containing protein n=1 Tax=Stylosanthes scabra TaxID=79078 RepID=A0ABU6ZQG3_9FABA|nr:hypothetical protein [Stylosanthes scabra]